tara:strand:- start:14888 stop:15280 length:393 start_codon:yes stop_codon:yes gene_type:complete
MNKVSEKERKSEAQRVRLTMDENQALKNLALEMGVKPSKLIRRLIREAVNQGPDFFDDGIKELRETNRQIGAIGRNLNRLVLMMNTDKRINEMDLKIEYDGLRLGYEAMGRSYQDLLRHSKERKVDLVKS